MEIKRAGSCVSLVAVLKDLPARAISIKNKHLLVVYSTPTRGFTAAVSVFRGTPPPKPLICKSVSNHLGALISDLWADPTGGMPRHSCALIRLALSDIIETSLCYHSQSVHLSLPSFTVISGKQKTLLTRGKQGVEILFRFVTCLPPDYPNSLRGIARHMTWIAQG